MNTCSGALGRESPPGHRPASTGEGKLHRLLRELGDLDERGRPVLDGVPVDTWDGMVSCRWRASGQCNRPAEEFCAAAPEGNGN